MSIKLSKRLAAIAAHIPPGGFADIGTDHGYIPAFLAENGYEGRIVAADIKPGPLSTAQSTALEAHVSDKIEFILCDGLCGLSSQGLSCIVIAGMGGETIVSILEAAPWTRGGCLLVLQPMSKSDVLRKWLAENGYCFLTEELCEDGILYEIMTVTGGKNAELSPAELHTGGLSLIGSDPLFPRRHSELREKLSRAVAGLEQSARPEDAARLSQTKAILSDLDMQEVTYANC